MPTSFSSTCREVQSESPCKFLGPRVDSEAACAHTTEFSQPLGSSPQLAVNGGLRSTLVQGGEWRGGQKNRSPPSSLGHRTKYTWRLPSCKKERSIRSEVQWMDGAHVRLPRNAGTHEPTCGDVPSSQTWRGRPHVGPSRDNPVLSVNRRQTIGFPP